MKKMVTVTLKEKEIKEIDGEFVETYVNEKRFPASITNYSMALGERLGLIESSQMTDLHEIQKIFEAAMNPGKHVDELSDGIQVTKYLKIIYLSVMGVNPELTLSFDEFTQLFHEDIPTTIDIFTDLVLGTMNLEENGFSKELQKNVKKQIKTNLK
jgi:hypothetical protein